ncbi:MAG TPA: preprotein translocase subunit YajC [Thermopetrobacter sp.]|nr:preprotein translocase subunit YajC [Thermopetrobacter sp.]
MFITPAFAQTAAGPGASGIFGMILPLILMMAVFWFLLIRPQQKKMKEHQAMLESIRRGDTIITSGGLVGKVAKVNGDELTVEIAPELKVKVLRGYVADVRAKGQPAKAGGEGK